MTTAATTAATVVAALTMTAAPAHADGVSRNDSGADVWTYDYDAEPADREVVKSPLRVNVAVEQVRATHTRDALVVRAQMRSLARNTDYFYLNVVTKDQDDQQFVSFLQVSPSDRDGNASVQAVGGPAVPCSGIRHLVDYGAEVLRLKVPRSCLDDPARFTVRGSVVNFPAGTPSGDVHLDQLFTDTSKNVATGSLARD